MANMNNKVYVDEGSNIDILMLNNWLAEDPEDGAIVTFTGKVRQLESATTGLYLEHYPAMTENVLKNIVTKARQRWDINRVAVIHRVGQIYTNELIVFVGISSSHRHNAFAAAEFIMDILKNEAPFWKKEQTLTGDNWVESKKSDQDALKKWN